jgi:hypothetical protein
MPILNAVFSGPPDPRIEAAAVINIIGPVVSYDTRQLHRFSHSRLLGVGQALGEGSELFSKAFHYCVPMPLQLLKKVLV